MMSSQSRWFLGAVVGLCVPVAVMAADANAPAAKLTAAQIVDKHVAARGGLQAWRGVQTMSWNGKMDVGYGDSAARSARYVSSAAMANSAKKKLIAQQSADDKRAADKQVQLPFLLEMKRPNKSRVEIVFAGKTAVQVYDGSNGWMMRPYLNRDDWEPFSPDQAKEEAANPGMDGLLLDYAKKGTKVDFESMEAVEGHDEKRRCEARLDRRPYFPRCENRGDVAPDGWPHAPGVRLPARFPVRAGFDGSLRARDRRRGVQGHPQDGDRKGGPEPGPG
jgi:hypothetical protein